MLEVVALTTKRLFSSHSLGLVLVLTPGVIEQTRRNSFFEDLVHIWTFGVVRSFLSSPIFRLSLTLFVSFLSFGFLLPIPYLHYQLSVCVCFLHASFNLIVMKMSL